MYFGKDCKFFVGLWDSFDIQADTEHTEKYKESPPVLSFCNHPSNPDDVEGNCKREICPLLLKKIEH